ncbi:fibronectin type III domain-containing protein [Acetivibrio mesophilus]|uniref:Fibronectin type III domain-containing protein n=1 Tax=Acetivibrio mesophilus TaxID=2487273 RepID=A0A4Q0I1G7_9FIRM|nr:fibronectin type III domain-containing protein [Acetivibrio mesophilus]ODM25916.1 hypothetical protein A7W90_06570 [Clostridium sp. Bc-iso-3]RXE57941.1 fibronectin type III domain-containing protein [Acetivibrio mesophilus]HHV29958.1 fibronectin type III domain-containing protein [Clostridium sp.]
MRRVISAVVAIILVFQAISFSAFAVSADDGKFKPAIDIGGQIDSEEISEEELQRIYEEFKREVESDIKAQEELIYEKIKEEEQLKEKLTKDSVKELAGKSSLSTKDGAAQNITMQSSELINAPYDLDAEVINASVSGKHVILTWMPSEGAEGYKIFQDGQQIGTSTIEKFEFDISQIGEYNYTVKAYKGTIESENSKTLTIVLGDTTISQNKILQHNYVYGDSLTISGGT